jgi:heme-degrading monooxygenase HmoA
VYASTTMFRMPPGSRGKMEQLADRMLASMKQMKGFVSITFLRNEQTNEYGGFALWKTKEDAEAAMKQTGSSLEDALSGSVIGPLQRKLFDVYAAKG